MEIYEKEKIEKLEIDEETKALWREGIREYVEAGGYWKSFKPSPKQMAWLRRNFRD